jgi:6-pyruvoyltetrahydropterin/6-carboxytetrahydropterin synthase
MLLPEQNPLVRLFEEGPAIRVRYRDRQWLFPRDDCVLLPIENTTAEMLARYIGLRLRDDLREQYAFEATVLRVEVEENIGQSATWELRR